MLKLNLKILVAHIIGCVMGFLSIFLISVFSSDIWYITTSALFTIVIFMLYVSAGFWANNGKHKGAIPIISIFWLSAALLLITLPIIIHGFNLKEARGLDVFAIYANASFNRLLFVDTPLIHLLYKLPYNLQFVILPLLPSSLAALGFALKNVYIERKKEKV